MLVLFEHDLVDWLDITGPLVTAIAEIGSGEHFVSMLSMGEFTNGDVAENDRDMRCVCVCVCVCTRARVCVNVIDGRRVAHVMG